MVPQPQRLDLTGNLMLSFSKFLNDTVDLLLNQDGLSRCSRSAGSREVTGPSWLGVGAAGHPMGEQVGARVRLQEVRTRRHGEVQNPNWNAPFPTRIF